MNSSSYTTAELGKEIACAIKNASDLDNCIKILETEQFSALALDFTEDTPSEDKLYTLAECLKKKTGLKTLFIQAYLNKDNEEKIGNILTTAFPYLTCLTSLKLSGFITEDFTRMVADFLTTSSLLKLELGFHAKVKPIQGIEFLAAALKKPGFNKPNAKRRTTSNIKDCKTCKSNNTQYQFERTGFKGNTSPKISHGNFANT